MRIIEITEEHILFDDGNEITYNHKQDCCEHNYADFKQLDDLGRHTDFDVNLIFEEVKGSGFRFGNLNGKMFFVPCYSLQNGYYSDDVDIYLNSKTVLKIQAKEILED